MTKEKKKMYGHIIAIAISLNYYYLTKFSLWMFPLVAIYTILFNRGIISEAVAVGVCTYCLYFQEVIARKFLAPANGDKEEAKKLIKSDIRQSMVNLFCIILGIVCLYFAWVNFFVQLIGGAEVFRGMVNNVIM